ncbi:uncharacterized protein LOC113290961 [Papaver somniferum]|uniref:uncharacterized protein LOC113290961 n=1 Tax=Papaver somniferum TaxID=3469 RepID=UPI000E6F59BE|nr:uncharacterized protein LOC113290961 [Papaver somniferum]
MRHLQRRNIALEQENRRPRGRGSRSRGSSSHGTSTDRTMTRFGLMFEPPPQQGTIPEPITQGGGGGYSPPEDSSSEEEVPGPEEGPDTANETKLKQLEEMVKKLAGGGEVDKLAKVISEAEKTPFTRELEQALLPLKCTFPTFPSSFVALGTLWNTSKYIVGSLHVGSRQRRYLIVATEYFTKWVEEAALRYIRDRDVFRFIYEHIICRFGIPAAIVSDNENQLQGKNIDMLFNTYNIRKSKATPIYPQSNGQAEITNKTIADNLKKKLDGKYGEWCEELHNVLWDYRTAQREATALSPYMLMYGIKEILPTEVMIPTIRTEA